MNYGMETKDWRGVEVKLIMNLLMEGDERNQATSDGGGGGGKKKNP